MNRRSLLKIAGIGITGLFSGKVLASNTPVSSPLYRHEYEIVGISRDMEGVPIIRVPVELIERSKEFRGYEERNLLHSLKQQLEEKVSGR